MTTGKHEQDILRDDPRRRSSERQPPDPTLEQNVSERRGARLTHEFRLWWRSLSRDEALDRASRRDELLGVLNEKYGYARDDAEAEIERALRALEESKGVRAADGGPSGV
jgi:hypothetical protein